MGPLVYYCRWRGVRLRLRGRDEHAVWGHLIAPPRGAESASSDAPAESAASDAEQAEPFRFDLTTWELWLGDEGARRLQLDELGVVIADDGAPGATTSAGDGRR